MNAENPFAPRGHIRPPLTFDRLLEGRPIAAHASPLLALPVELLAEVLRYVEADKPSLASLALVNSDCRQLARACQFRTVTLDTDPVSAEILGKLMCEAAERSHHPNRLTHQPSLGACIRGLKTASKSHWDEILALSNCVYSYKAEIESDSEPAIETADTDMGAGAGAGVLTRAAADASRAAAVARVEGLKRVEGNLTARMHAVQFTSLAMVLPSLPYLEVLDWEESSSFAEHTATLLESAAYSSVQHFRLGDVAAFSQRLAPQLEPASHMWPLKTLDLTLTWHCLPETATATEAAVYSRILAMCCRTLRRLRIAAHAELAPPPTALSFSLPFPCLGAVEIGSWAKLDGLALRSLLASPRLTSLAINPSCLQADVLDHVGRPRSLERLVWNGVDAPTPEALWLLEDMSSLTAFALAFAKPPLLLDRILDALERLPVLRTLAMLWDQAPIPASSLAALSRLRSLENLHVSADGGDAWLTDHDEIRFRLRPLRDLRMLVLSSDSYLNSTPELDEEEDMYMRYYPFSWTFEHGADAERWEVLHRGRMISEVERYAATFGKLECMYIGQLYFGVQTDPVSKKRTVIPLSEKRSEKFGEHPAYEAAFGSDVY